MNARFNGDVWGKPWLLYFQIPLNDFEFLITESGIFNSLFPLLFGMAGYCLSHHLHVSMLLQPGGRFLTFLLLVAGFHVHGVKRKAGLSRNREVGDSQGVHLFLSLTPGAAL